MKASTFVSLSTLDFNEEELSTDLDILLFADEETSAQSDGAVRVARLNKTEAITLSGLSTDLVIGRGLADFRKEYFDCVVDSEGKIGSFVGKPLPQGIVFDATSKRDRAYGTHVYNIAAALSPASVVHSGMVYGKSFLANRMQVQIASDLQTDPRTGEKFYFIGVRRFGILSEATDFAYRDTGRGGVQARIKLYTNVEKGTFYFKVFNKLTQKHDRIYQVPGDVQWYDLVKTRLNMALPSGASRLDIYTSELNKLDENVAEDLRGTQLMFFEVYKTAKAAIIAAKVVDAPQA
jgi:hypothetical protein